MKQHATTVVERRIQFIGGPCDGQWAWVRIPDDGVEVCAWETRKITDVMGHIGYHCKAHTYYLNPDEQTASFARSYCAGGGDIPPAWPGTDWREDPDL